MKRIVLLTISIILVMCCLSGCIVIRRYRHFEIDESTVSSIQIYDLCEIESYRDQFINTETPVYEISEEQIADFITDLNNIEFSDHLIITIAAIDPSFNYDTWTVRINYTDGSYELISYAGYGQTFNSNDECIKAHHWSCERDEWEVFVANYVPSEIFNHHPKEK